MSSIKHKSAPASKSAARSIPVTHADEDVDEIDMDIDLNDIREIRSVCTKEKCLAAYHQIPWESVLLVMDLLKHIMFRSKSGKKADKKAAAKAEKKEQKKAKKALSKTIEKFALYGLILLAVTFILHRLFRRK